ncbi:MAG: Methyltransferase type 11 [Candidatus Woesebacteria bacterium GW2011_GWA1_33_30]|uniref:Methyltransferase type 11 n=1 Tax=Candidatus Woesebacteria bacterium GW2011_GWA2_33_28 TaxID=1618561 RepID=A0A0G0C6B0_9BACT|nr:MAG: Methyltransferase type 11 [Candidatus Woesebacteria bacterium GW2011_GWA2_33_28]KKP47572.1 MAG: Methyltransferase type 11 [Candidatus Woesebacteria bacterium GW2011_GWA1_33_30]KKP49193.1 MAG: Methyltransferase type 11 [Microgenomates group bacterium GW2011_GWC1_33_32]KKP51685.1 MAG: Methyltransferase type 11 [Candidatus Woesebacteria bacterium GW2011_GWB1_33_38]KKP58466.1 MAG: Methyltransferase type 11 [Microgenomates group bacterium GW2011_GWD1_33_9]
MTKILNLIKTWDKESESYLFEKKMQVDYLANYYHLENCLGNLNKKTILEVGSGSGQTSAYLATHGGIIHLVDISSKSLNFSKKYFDSLKLPVNIYNQNAFNMKFPNKSFDYVWNGGVLEHYNDAEKVELIKKMWKLVKPGGKILITTPNLYDIPFIVAKKILEFRKKWSFGLEENMSMKKIRDLAKKAGVTNIHIYAYNPIVGFWFFPYGREITDFLKLNTFKYHKRITKFGHVIIMYGVK